MSNESAKGYFILTLKKLGYKNKEIEKILDELYHQFDEVTEYEAGQYSFNWRFEDEN